MSRLCRIAVLLGVLLGAAPAFAAEVIQSFNSNVEVAKDGELTVTEILRVHAEGSAMQHGIYRDFPLAFRDAAGTLREMTFSLIGVMRDNQAEPYHTERTHGVIRIYAGDKDVLIRPGEHTYVFRYRTGRQIRWFDGKPELNWNVTGNFWSFPILYASYHLHLAGSEGPVRWTAFTGRVAELPAGVVEPPSANTLLWYQLFDNRQWFLGGVGFFVILIYYFAAWEAVGRDPKPGTIIPLFHPPQGISPALANYIHNWGLGREKWRAFTAAALSLAVRGLVHFDNKGGALTLKITGKKPDGGFTSLPAGEVAIYSWVNIGGSAIIDKAHGELVAKVGTAFTTSIEAENRNRFFRRNLGYVFAGLAMTVAVVIGLVSFGGLEDQDIPILAGLCFGGFFLGMFTLPVLQALAGDGARFAVLARAAMSLVFTVIIVSIIFSSIPGILHSISSDALPALQSLVIGNPFPFVLVTAFIALNGLFFHLMRAPT